MRASKRQRNNPMARHEPRSEPTTTTIIRTEEGWQGPLPSPKSLEEFRALVPDAPERIMRQWETESEHRRGQERRALNGAIWRDRIGQIGAIMFLVMVLSVVSLALWLDHPWIAGILGAGTISSVVGAFLYQRHSATTE
ncbi:DUF2335 domain-containing protein [Methylobacterium planeticum]|uniref:DUF2335 domain-containing protein n=1 Tax=Methylobacterium planeticum TaxID=2615211 RepID=A0A6N6MJ94_9HYPH|nr:DUF2335 domain-containing protein [Methylobacterium planeticum]KAB1068893.1 DUF2335 domain-containing protein [Methylobacterium planeticum]